MNKCIICNQEIKTDSQFINGNWYHNNCIELIAKQNKAYENMRKDLLDLILYKYPALSQSESNFKDDLLNILNKVGGNDE